MATAICNHEADKYVEDYNILKLKIAINEFSLKIEAMFKKYENPYEFCISCLDLFAKEHLYTNVNSLPARIIKEFEKFLKLNPAYNIDSPLLTEVIQKKVFDCLFLIKQKGTLRSLTKCFCLNSIPEILVPIFVTKVKEGCPMDTLCNIIAVLKFSSYINVDNVLMPLFLLNQYEVIEELLTSESCEITSASKLKKIINKICKKESQIKQLQLRYNMEGVPIKGSNDIRNFGFRLDKHVRRAKSILMGAHKNTISYLFRMYYKKNAMTLESLVLYAADLSKLDSRVMVNFVLKMFDIYKDYNGAKMYWVKMRRAKVKDHPIIIKLKNINCSPKRAITNKNTNWYQLNIPIEHIVTIDNITQFTRAMIYLKSCKVISMDLEWKSANKYDEPEKVSLLQIATKEKVFLFDMKNLPLVLNDDKWKTLGEIVSSENVLKLAYDRSSDEIKLKGISHHLAKMKNCLDLHESELALLETHPSIYSHKTVDYRGLSGLVFQCFGLPLDKMEQCSYWDLRPLTTSQVLYSALDAYCLLDIYHYFNEKAKQLGIKDWKLLKPTDIVSRNCLNGLVTNKPKIMNIKDPKFVCDNMFRELGRLMLLKDIDTKILDRKDGHDKCLELFENEERIILTNEAVYRKMRWFVPETNIVCIVDTDLKTQFAQVSANFNPQLLK